MEVFQKSNNLSSIEFIKGGYKMFQCAICKKEIKEWCDQMSPVVDEDGNDAGFVCAECALQLELEPE